MTTPCELVQIEYQGNGTVSVFAFPFPYDFKTEVKVALWNNTTKKHEDILTTDATYPWEVNDANPTAVTFTGTVPPSPPASDVNEDPIYNVRIYRITDMTDIRSVFNQGSAIRAADLNKNFEQLRYAIQEGKCQIPDKLLEYLDEYYWNNYSDVVYSNETWVSNDQTLATTAALDARFQDEANETLISSETWVADDDHIATTQSLEQRFDTLIETDILVDSTGLTKSASGGQTTLGIGSNSVDLDRIKTADIVQTADYSTTWTGVNDKVSTVGALEARHDVVVSTTQPTTAQVGKQWLDITPGNQKHQIYDGSGWRTVAVGQPFSPATATIVRYVDATNGSDAVDVTGFLPQAPLQSIKRAVDLINSDSSDGSLVVVAPGVYQETLPIQIQRNNVSIVGQALRSCFVQPTQATETNTMFECNSGTLLANMTFVGLKASGTRGNSTYDDDATYGLPENQGWACAFYSGATIKKSPYIQNCTNFTDSSIDNSVKYDQTNLPAGGLGGDTNSAMSGGGILCDGSVPASSSPLRSFVVDSFTQVALDGPGILCTNNGYAQLVSFFGTFCHYHAKALNGGQLNLSNCTTDFGRYGLIADGRSTSAQITGSSVGTAAAAATSVVVDGLTAQGGFFSNQPGSTMIMEVGGNDYQILDASQVSGNQCTINIYRATNADPNTNLGLVAQINNNTSVSFKLRSYISTGGHTFEYVGSGTDYSAHPDYGGQAVEANQVVELGGTGSADAQIYNRGKVWQSSTDENGLFKVGDKFKVDQRRGTITLDGFTVAAEVVSDTSPQLGGDLDLNSNDITGTGNVNITGTVTTSADASINSLTVGRGAGNISTNTAVGRDALNANTTGGYNTANGYEALTANTTGNYNVANGYEALTANTTGSFNVANGFQALTANTTGYSNVASGYRALYTNTTGHSNVANGDISLYLNTTGSNNTANGRYSLHSNTTGGYNIANGAYALFSNTTGNNNTANGYQALYLNTTGIDNVASGYRALYSNTTGSSNTANGYQALRSNTTGGNNVATGHLAFYLNTTGSSNVSTGSYALNRNTTGSNNAAIGRSALYVNTTGGNNTATGKDALGLNTTGSNNTTLGYQAGYALTTGSNNTIIGAIQGTAGLADTVIIGSGTTERARCDSAGIWSFLGTGSVVIPIGTEAQRPSTAAKGMLRFNDDIDKAEIYNGTSWGTLDAPDIGTSPEQIPLNQYLGKQAFVDEVGTLRPYFPTGSFYSAPQTGGDIQFRYVSDTSIQIVMKGLDGTIRSTTLTLS